MAIYHCSIKIIKRSEERSAVAAAAYRGGEKLINEWDGVPIDEVFWVQVSIARMELESVISPRRQLLRLLPNGEGKSCSLPFKQ